MSEATAETTTTETEPKQDDSTDTSTATQPDRAAEQDWKAEAEKWKALSRKHEDQSKANADKAKQYDEFEESQKTELQKVIDKAEAAEKRASELEQAKVRAEVAASKGIPASLLSGTTEEELTASADALLAFRGEKPKPDFGGGDRGSDVGAKAKQLTADDVKRLYAERKYAEIEQARKDGLLTDVLGG